MRSKHLFALVVLFALLLGSPAFSRTALATQADFTPEQRPQLATPILVVNTSFLNVRSGPGSQYTIIATVSGGTELPVLGTNGDNSWYLVLTTAGAGWVDVDYTIARGDFRYVPLVEVAAPATPAPQTAVTIALPLTGQGGGLVPAPAVARTVPAARVVVNTSYLNIRSGPGGQYSIITVASGGTELKAIGVTGDGIWFLVEGNFGRGWVNQPFVVFRGDYSAVPIIENVY